MQKHFPNNSQSIFKDKTRPLAAAQVEEFDIAPGGGLPSISCPVSSSLAADAFALMRIGSMAGGKTILWAWMSRGFLCPQEAANHHFGGDLQKLEEHMKPVRGLYRQLLTATSLPTLDNRALAYIDPEQKTIQSRYTQVFLTIHRIWWILLDFYPPRSKAY